MKARLDALLTSLIPGLIVWIGMVSWSYLLTGHWPPQYLLVSASLGGMASPWLWRRIARWRDRPAGTMEVERPEGPTRA